MKHDELYVAHILDAIAAIERYLDGVSYDAFLDSRLLQDGVIRELEIIGEASKQLADAFRERFLHIPWADITGMRDKLIHEYFGVDLELVWKTVKDDLPVLKDALQ